MKFLRNDAPHVPVLLDEVISCFAGLDDGYIIDCTLGFGGHSAALLKAVPNIKIIACDQDEKAIEFSKKRFEAENGRIFIKKCNFSKLFDGLENSVKIAGILADIGVSSLQLDDDERGFSLNSHELDMRMDKSKSKNAKNVINEYSKTELEKIFLDYGELKMAGKIADKIIAARAKKPINSALELASIIGDEKIKGRNVSIAKLAFQAIRIEVNDELDALRALLDTLEKSKPSGAKLAIIAFHSLEDRIIKEKFKLWAKDCICDENAFKCSCGANHALGKIITKKPIVPSMAEIKANPRSACSKMRIFEFFKEIKNGK